MNETMSAVAEICETIIGKVDRAYVAECGRRHERPDRLWQLWADTGLLAIGLPEAYGGAGGDVSEVVLAHDLLYRAGLVMPATVTNFMSRTSIVRHGSEEQKQRYLPSTASGESFFAAGITEPDSGTNLFKIRSTARRQPSGDYVLNGQKCFITGFREAGQALVVARTTAVDAANRSAGLSLFIVDTKTPGISSTLMDIAMHLPDHHYVVMFDEVLLPAENLLGLEGQGAQVLFDWLNPERLFTSAMSVGQADHVLSRAAEYAKVRAPFDAPIGSYQSIQHPLALAKARIEAARGMLYSAAAKFDAGEDVGLETNMVKYLSSEAFSLASSAAMTTFGGSSFDLSQDILPFFLLSKLQETAPVNNNMVLNFIAEKALGLPKSY
jgi:acyl-CoA dehydrogenase